ncbi:hypothetical protein [Microcystis phage Mwe-JY26]
MAQLAVAVGGAAIGFAVGGPAGAQAGFLIGSAIGGYLFAPTVKQEGPRLSDLTVTSSTFGASIPLLYGTARIPGNIIWSTGLVETKNVNTRRVGKGGQKVSSTTYTYSASFAIGFCRGPVSSVLKVWADGKLIYDRSALGPVSTNKFLLRFYEGTANQAVDPLIEQKVGVGNTPAYRDLCYVVFEDMQLADFGNRIPLITAEIATGPVTTDFVINRITTSPGIFGSEAGNQTFDWATRRFFVHGTGTTDGVSVYDFDRMVRITQKSMSDMLNEPASSTFGEDMAVAQGGDLFYLYDSRLYKINSSTLEAVDFWGDRVFRNLNSSTGFGQSPGYLAVNTVASPTGRSTYVAVGSELLGNYMIFDADTMLPIVGFSGPDFIPLARTSVAARVRVLPGISTEDYCDFYLINSDGNGASTEVLYIYRIRIGAAGLVILFEGPKVLDLTSFLENGLVTGIGVDYNPLDDTILFHLNFSVAFVSRPAALKYDYNDDQLVWSIKDNNLPFADIDGHIGSRIVTNQWGLGLNDRLTILDTLDGSIIYQSNDILTFGQNWAVWDGVTESLIGQTTRADNDVQRFIRIYPNRQTPGVVTLASVITSLCLLSGLTLTDIDVTGVSGNLRGYVIARPTTARAALEQLCSAYFIETVESDFKIKFRNRGGASVATIPERWLGSSGGDRDSFWKHQRTQEIELPRRVSVVHWDPSIDYQQGTQQAQRITAPLPSVFAKAEVNVEYPIVLTATEARQLSEKMLYTAWTERDRYTAKLPWRYLNIDPGDSVVVNLDDGSSYAVRMVKVTEGADLSLDAEFVSEDVATFGSTIPGAPTNVGFPPQTITVIDPARLFLLDIPLLRDVDDSAAGGIRVYYAAGQYKSGWPGGQIGFSIDASLYEDFDPAFASVNWGTASGALPPPPSGAFATDTSNTLTVYMQDGSITLASVTRAQLLAGANAALVGDEIIQFQTVSVNPDGSYTLSNLLRGRRGTEYACGTHQNGETFILLEPSTMLGQVLPVSALNQLRYYRLTTFGGFVDDSIVLGHTFTGAAEKPYAPVGIRRQTSGSDLDVTWIRRTRIGTTLQNGTFPKPLNEASEAYEAYVLSAPFNPDTFDATNPATYVRKFGSLTTPTFKYLSAQMATDGFDLNTSTLHVVVFQVSALVGLGFPGSASLPAAP